MRKTSLILPLAVPLLLVCARAQQTAPFPASMDLSSLTGVDGFVLYGEQPIDFGWRSVASAGDVNGDNITDLIIGAPYANSYAGKSYAVFGRKMIIATFQTTLPQTSRLITSIISTSSQSMRPTLPLTTWGSSLTSLSMSTGSDMGSVVPNKSSSNAIILDSARSTSSSSELGQH